MKRKLFSLCLLILAINVSAIDIYVSPKGGLESQGTQTDPMSFEAAINKASDLLKTKGLPQDGMNINLMGGLYRYKDAIVLGEEFSGSEDNPIVIKAIEGQDVQFNGSVLVKPESFKPVKNKKEKARLAAKAADKILVATVKDKAMIVQFNKSLMLNLSFDGKNYLPSVFPNVGYADFVEKTVTPEVSAPAVPVGKEHHGVRAGHVPYREVGKPRAWKGSLEEPRGARAKIGDKEAEMAGTWTQWEAELKRNNTRNQLTGFIEASWLLSSQDIYAASAKDECIHLSRALAYGWAWRKNDKPFRVFGMLCELDAPGEWYFDTQSNKLYIYPPEPLHNDTEVSLSVADGFIVLDGASYVTLEGLSVSNVGGGVIYDIAGDHNLVAACNITNSTAVGVRITGRENKLLSCDLVDLNMHANVSAGIADGTEISPAYNVIENCHIYQKQFKHEKVNIAINGCGNIFRHNMIHNSIGQAMVVNGNEHIVEYNELFNIGFEEGDGGAIYSGADLGGYGNVYRYNFFHHLIHCPGKVSRAGIHLDDGQCGATCYGNIFYKSASKALFAFGGAGHTMYDNVFLEGDRGAYFCRALGEKMWKIEKEIRNDPNHHRIGTKEDYVGRVEKRIGKDGWAKSPWIETYPEFNKIMSDTSMYGRFWPIRYKIHNNYQFGNHNDKIADHRICDEVMAQNFVEDYKQIKPSDFVDYEAMDFEFKNKNRFPAIPFHQIGLVKDQYRTSLPDKAKYRGEIKAFYKDIKSYKGTKDQIDTSVLVE